MAALARLAPSIAHALGTSELLTPECSIREVSDASGSCRGATRRVEACRRILHDEQRATTAADVIVSSALVAPKMDQRGPNRHYHRASELQRTLRDARRRRYRLIGAGCHFKRVPLEMCARSEGERSASWRTNGSCTSGEKSRVETALWWASKRALHVAERLETIPVPGGASFFERG